MSKSKLIFAGVTVFLIIFLVGGFALWFKSFGKPEEVTLTFWGVFDDPSSYAGIIGSFKQEQLALKRNPKDVTIEYKKFEYGSYEKELDDAWDIGQGPDIFLIHNTWLPKYQSDISPFPPPKKEGMNYESYTQSFMPVATQDLTRSGQIFAFPLSVDTLALYYNKDILQEYYQQNLEEPEILKPPTTWTELIDRLEVVTDKDEWGTLGKAGMALGTASNINRASDILSLIMLQTGTKMVSDDFASAAFDRTTTVDGAAYNPGEKSLEFYTSFADPTKTVYTWNNKKDYSIDEFAEGDVAMMLGYSHSIGSLQKKSPNLNYGIAPVPQLAQAKNSVNFANYWGLSVSRFSQNKELAWEFIEFASRYKNVWDYLTRTNRPTARIDLIANQESEMPEISIFAKQGRTAKTWYQADSGETERIFLEMIDKIVFTKSTISRAINDAAKEVTALMREL
jgi:multiple sugar transport system substrate-binding protein